MKAILRSLAVLTILPASARFGETEAEFKKRSGLVCFVGTRQFREVKSETLGDSVERINRRVRVDVVGVEGKIRILAESKLGEPCQGRAILADGNPLVGEKGTGARKSAVKLARVA